MRLRPSLVIAPLLLSVAAWTRPAPGTTQSRTTSPPPAAAISFHRDVSPILRSQCVGCHGDKNPASGLTLTSYTALMKGGKGGAALVAGKSGESRVVKYLLGTLQPKMSIGGAREPPEIAGS